MFQQKNNKKKKNMAKLLKNTIIALILFLGFNACQNEDITTMFPSEANRFTIVTNLSRAGVTDNDLKSFRLVIPQSEKFDLFVKKDGEGSWKTYQSAPQGTVTDELHGSEITNLFWSDAQNVTVYGWYIMGKNNEYNDETVGNFNTNTGTSAYTMDLQDIKNFDVLYAHEVVSQSNKGNVLNVNFKHLLSTINITCEAGIELTSVKMEFYKRYTWDPAIGIDSYKVDSKITHLNEATFAKDEGNNTFHCIIPPQDISGFTLDVQVSGTTYNIPFRGGMVLEHGKEYGLEITQDLLNEFPSGAGVTRAMQNGALLSSQEWKVE